MSGRWGVNPVTLKELRQMARSRLVASGLIAFLVVQLLGVSLVLLTGRSDGGSAHGLYGQALGQGVFHTVYFLLSAVLLICVPLFMGARLALERGRDHLDLQFTTALTPRQFVDGKIASAALLLLYFASASLPFLMLSYLLRGVDLFRVLWALYGLLLWALGILYAILFLSAVAMSRAFRLLVLLGVVLTLLYALGALNMSASLRMSGRLPFSSWDAFVPFVLGLLLFASVCALLRAVTVAALSPAHANRSVPVRGLFTGVWLVWGAVGLVEALVEGDAEGVLVWALVSVLASAALLLVAVSMPEGYSRRVLAGVSARAPARAVQFLFFSGAESGMVWALALGFGSVLAALLFEALQPRAGNDTEITAAHLVAAYLYLSAAACSVRALWQYALRGRVTCRLVGVVALVLVALGSLLPYLLTVGGSAAEQARAGRWFGNVAGLFHEDDPDLGFHIACGGVWAAAAWIACMPFLRGAFRRFAAPAAPARAAEAEEG